MVDFLVTTAQALGIAGLLYGAYLCIRYGGEEDASSKRRSFDPMTTHLSRHEPADTPDNRLRKVA